VLITKVVDLKFELNLRKSVFENASSFYEEAKILEAKTEGLRKAIVETESKTESFRRTQLRLKNEEDLPVRARERSWFEKFHWVKSSEELLIVGGRDASANELLIKRYMDKDDLVFHADISGAPFVLLKTEGKTPAEQTIFEAAQLAVSYSKGWGEGYTSLDVYWVKPDQVSKQAPSGEFLTKGMFMVRGQKNYIRSVPLHISIGIVENGGELSVIGGPISAINGQARYRVEIVPGRQSSGMIAKTVRYSLAANATKELRGRILKLKIEELQRFIPAGKSEIAIR
ncbi:MAG: NFACT RNA binding domain-containing protein, partial [Candidatus Bathyarchaeota archaeon]